MQRKAHLYYVLRICLVIFLMGSLLFISGCGKSADQSTAQNNEETKTEDLKYPEKPITLVIPYDAGGSVDVTARKAAQLAEKELGVSMVVVNKPGASGAVGLKEVYNSGKNDGYTIVVAPITLVLHNLQGNLDFDHSGFESIISYCYDPAVVAVKKDSQFKTIEEFIDYAKKNPGAIKLGTTAPGGIWNVATKAMLSKLGLEVNLIQDGAGGAKTVTMAAGGHIDAVVSGTADLISQVQAGNVKLLGVMGADRVQGFPDIPTFKEKGYEGIEFYSSRHFFAPKDTPQEIVNKLYSAFKSAVESQEYKDFLQGLGSVPMNLDPEGTVQYLDAQKALYKELL